MRPATLASAALSLAASMTCAPAAASAAAVAAPMPRLAPVTIASRPASQCARLPADSGPGTGPDEAPVELLVCIQAPFQVEMVLGMIAARAARDLDSVADAVGRRLDVARRDEEAGHAVGDDLGESAALERDDRRPGRLRIGSGHAEWLVPHGRADHDRRLGHGRPERGPRYRRMDGHS